MIAVVGKDGKLQFHVSRTHHPHRWYALLMGVALLVSTLIGQQRVDSAGLDTVTVTLMLSDAVNANTPVRVAFPIGGLSNGETISIYLGETTAGDEWQIGGTSIAEISCTDDGTGETYTAVSVTAASATVPMYAVFTATTVGAGATTVTCIIGAGASDPVNPISADGYSIAVITTEDAGAGIAYVGSANDVTVTAQTLPNLSLTIDGADGSACTTSSGVTSCNLGIVLTSTVNTGFYDVNIGTNATSGATMLVQQDQALTSGGDTITAVVENNTVTAGNEAYGVALSSNASWTEQGDFTDDDTPIPGTATTVATTASPIDATGDDVTVTHRIAVGSSTESGNYSHVTTWTATANF